MPGANLLAVIGLTLLPSAPTAQGLRTSCLFQHEGREIFAWPLWTASLTADETISLLVHPDDSTSESFASSWNLQRGVFARFAVERYSAQKNAYFNTSVAI